LIIIAATCSDDPLTRLDNVYHHHDYLRFAGLHRFLDYIKVFKKIRKVYVRKVSRQVSGFNIGSVLYFNPNGGEKSNNRIVVDQQSNMLMISK
jgi:hypothetical protein